jgi:uncharacterized membrane protein YbhN (UPF0104 family)
VLGTIAVTLVALWIAARGVDPSSLADTFRGVRWEWVAAGAAANAVQVLMFGFAWRTGLVEGGVGSVPLRHVISATWIGKAGNALLPARLGEVARVMVIRRHVCRERGTIARVAGTLVAQRVLSSLATFIVVVLVATSMPLPVPVPALRWLAVGAVLALVVTVIVASRYRLGARARRKVPRRLQGVLGSVIDGAGILRERGPAARSLGMHVVAVVAQLTTLGCLLHAFGVAAPATAPLVVLAMVMLAGVLPASPGGIGVTQAAIVVPLGATYHVSANLALAFALGLQATIVVVAVIGGLAGLAHQRLSRPHIAGTP